MPRNPNGGSCFRSLTLSSVSGLAAKYKTTRIGPDTPRHAVSGNAVFMTFPFGNMDLSLLGSHPPSTPSENSGLGSWVSGLGSRVSYILGMTYPSRGHPFSCRPSTIQPAMSHMGFSMPYPMTPLLSTWFNDIHPHLSTEFGGRWWPLGLYNREIWSNLVKCATFCSILGTCGLQKASPGRFFGIPLCYSST